MKKLLFAGFLSILFLLIIGAVSHPQEGPGYFIGRCPELNLWKNNPLFLQAKDLYNRGNRPELNNEWQQIVNKVDQFDAEMTEFVKTCSELKARADATNARVDDLKRRLAAWDSRWVGKPFNSSAMSEKNQLEAEIDQLESEQQARNAEWSAMKAQRDFLDTKYQQLEREVPRFISSVQAGGTPKNAGQPLDSAESSIPNATATPTQQNIEEAKKLSEQGNQYSKNKQWQQAVDSYLAALGKTPGNAELRRKCAFALKNLAAEQRKAMAAPTVSGPSMQQLSLQRLQELHRLNEQGEKYYKNQQWQQAADMFRKATEICPNSEENRISYAVALDRLAAELRKGQKREFGSQAKSVYYHSKTAEGLANKRDYVGAKHEAAKGFDTPGDYHGSFEVDLSGMGKRPEWPASVYKDKKMITLQKQQDSFKATYQQKEKELSQVRMEMENAAPGEKGKLAVKGAEIKQKMADAEYNAALKEKEIRETGENIKKRIDTREESSR